MNICCRSFCGSIIEKEAKHIYFLHTYILEFKYDFVVVTIAMAIEADVSLQASFQALYLDRSLREPLRHYVHERLR